MVLQIKDRLKNKRNGGRCKGKEKDLSHSGDLNPRPANYESAALPTELKWQKAPTPTPPSIGGGVGEGAVGMRRLELPTPTSRTWCASQLRYIPIPVSMGRKSTKKILYPKHPSSFNPRNRKLKKRPGLYKPGLLSSVKTCPILHFG